MIELQPKVEPHPGNAVLLIEDEPNIAEAISFILSRDGWQVTHLAEGQAALQTARRLRPALVILDHMLPGLSGLDILTAIRGDAQTASLPVLMLTAKGLPRDREQAERAGVSRFMTKPFSNAEILAVVRMLAKRGSGPGLAASGQAERAVQEGQNGQEHHAENGAAESGAA